MSVLDQLTWAILTEIKLRFGYVILDSGNYSGFGYPDIRLDHYLWLLKI